MKNLLIYYFMGFRGNFLATILTDAVTEVKFSNFDLRDIASGGYQKMHSLQLCLMDKETDDFRLFNKSVRSFDDLFDSVKQVSGTSIRILPHDVDDIIDAAHLALTKNHTPDYDPCELYEFCKYSYENLLEDIEHRSKFDYIVYAGDLYNIDKIKEIYFKINGYTLDPQIEPYIIHNYTLQNRLTQRTNNPEIIQSMINKIRSTYMNHFK